MKAAVETFGLISMTKDFGWELQGEVYGDASAALGVIHRNVLGKFAIFKQDYSGYSKQQPNSD